MSVSITPYYNPFDRALHRVHSPLMIHTTQTRDMGLQRQFLVASSVQKLAREVRDCRHSCVTDVEEICQETEDSCGCSACSCQYVHAYYVMSKPTPRVQATHVQNAGDFMRSGHD